MSRIDPRVGVSQTPPAMRTELRTTPLRIAVVNDYDLIVRGLTSMLAPYRDRVEVVETSVGGVASAHVDIALFDTFGGHRSILDRARAMTDAREVDHVVLYTWSTGADLLSIARASGVSGVLSKEAGAEELIDGLERIVSGERIGVDPVTSSSLPSFVSASDPSDPDRATLASGRSGRLQRRHTVRRAHSPTPSLLDLDLTPRQEEILAMLGQGLSNRDIADEVFLGVETVRTYVRQVYQKLGVKNRTQAAVRARSLGLEPIGERRHDTP